MPKTLNGYHEGTAIVFFFNKVRSCLLVNIVFSFIKLATTIFTIRKLPTLSENHQIVCELMINGIQVYNVTANVRLRYFITEIMGAKEKKNKVLSLLIAYSWNVHCTDYILYNVHCTCKPYSVETVLFWQKPLNLHSRQLLISPPFYHSTCHLQEWLCIVLIF